MMARLRVLKCVPVTAQAQPMAKNFFEKVGFRSLVQDRLPKNLKRPMYLLFVMRNVGQHVTRVEDLLSAYKVGSSSSLSPGLGCSPPSGLGCRAQHTLLSARQSEHANHGLRWQF